MDAASRETTHDLMSWFSRIVQMGEPLSFFQAVHLIENHYPEKPRIGMGGPAGEEPLRFIHDASLSFPISDITGIEQDPQVSERLVLQTTFLGLVGSVSPLPSFYSEDILWNQEDDDPVKMFMDMFHHRLISLFYRAFAKYRYPIQYQTGGKDEISRRMFAVMGLWGDELQAQLNVLPARFLAYVGILSQHPDSGALLETLLRDYLEGCRVNLRQCVGHWLEIETDQKLSLGKQNCVLGDNTTLGDRIWDVAGKFQIDIGPLDYETFRSLLPDGDTFDHIRQLVRLFLTDQLDFDFKLILQAGEIPAFRLDPEEPLQLGWTTVFPYEMGKDMELVVKGG